MLLFFFLQQTVIARPVRLKHSQGRRFDVLLYLTCEQHVNLQHTAHGCFKEKTSVNPETWVLKFSAKLAVLDSYLLLSLIGQSTETLRSIPYNLLNEKAILGHDSCSDSSSPIWETERGILTCLLIFLRPTYRKAKWKTARTFCYPFKSILALQQHSGLFPMSHPVAAWSLWSLRLLMSHMIQSPSSCTDRPCLLVLRQTLIWWEMRWQALCTHCFFKCN